MSNRILVTTGDDQWHEKEYHCPEPGEIDIQVQSCLTGICRSDIDMAQGKFPLLPQHMSGHEGLARVIKRGSGVTDVEVGDIVATRGEPAYADIYNVRYQEYVRVPEIHPRYIIEPVACGINVVMQARSEIQERCLPGSRLALLGSGFLAWVAYNTLLYRGYALDEIDVIGSSNKDIWGQRLKDKAQGTYDIVIDLSSHDYVFRDDILNSNALVILGTQKQVTTDFSNLLWKACTMIFPSPRNYRFHQCMVDAVSMIENGELDVDRFWTRGYNRNTAWQQAFHDSSQRALGFGRAYLEW